jgi:hypothetical protein
VNGDAGRDSETLIEAGEARSPTDERQTGTDEIIRYVRWRLGDAANSEGHQGLDDPVQH